MSPGDQVKHQAPFGAYFYRLVHRTSNGSHRTFPQNPTTCFFLANSPPSLAPGTYDIVYYDIGMKALDSTGRKVVFPVEHSTSPQLGLFAVSPASMATVPSRKMEQDAWDEAAHDNEAADDAAEDGDQAAEGETNDQDAGEEDDKPFSLKRARARDQLAAREDARHRRMLQVQLAADKQTQKTVRESLHTREVGETHQLSALLRREVVEANRIAALSNKRGFDELGRYREANQALREDYEANLEALHRSVEKTMALVEFVTEKVATKLAAPPPPTTDFTGLGKAAIEMLEKVGVALLTRGAPAPTAHPSIPPALAPPQAAPVVQPAPAVKQPVPAVPSTPNPALSRLAAKFASRGELELARQMSTPEGMRALFEEIGAEMEGTAANRPPVGDGQEPPPDGGKRG